MCFTVYDELSGAFLRIARYCVVITTALKESVLLILLLLLLSHFSRVRLCGTPQMAAHQVPMLPKRELAQRDYGSLKVTKVASGKARV